MLDGPMNEKVSVLLIAWRRPDTINKVLKAIGLYKPSKLFVACDGPIEGIPSEMRKVIETREAIDIGINWDCNVKYLYSDSNLGCREGVSRAVNWFFQNVEEGVILEDDCIPHPDFFNYCDQLLRRYRDDKRVWCISGCNSQGGHWRGDGNYFFGKIPQVWGWASWRRCWKHYDVNMKKWPKLKESNLLKTIFEDPLEEKYWTNIWDDLFLNGRPNTWDYQWCFTCMSNGGMTIFPNENLITNIGFGKDATHTIWENEVTPFGKGLDEILHPSFVLKDSMADKYTFDYKFGGLNIRLKSNFIYRFKNKLKLLSNKIEGKTL